MTKQDMANLNSLLENLKMYIKNKNNTDNIQQIQTQQNVEQFIDIQDSQYSVPMSDSNIATNNNVVEQSISTPTFIDQNTGVIPDNSAYQSNNNSPLIIEPDAFGNQPIQQVK